MLIDEDGEIVRRIFIHICTYICVQICTLLNSSIGGDCYCIDKIEWLDIIYSFFCWFFADENSPSLVELYLDVDITSFTEENKVLDQVLSYKFATAFLFVKWHSGCAVVPPIFATDFCEKSWFRFSFLQLWS